LPGAAHASLSGSRVLVVDDDERVRRLAAQLLTRGGFSVLTAAGGGEAVEIVGRAESNVTAVLLDLNMPGLSGKETLTRLRRVRPDLPVLVTSGSGEVDAADGIAWDARTAFLQKPYRAADLHAALGRLLAASA
jgi:CheY-like chemotaxis protein